MPSNQFLNSKSMLTPGIAGGTIMLITNALGMQFGLPHSWTALGLAFVVGTVVFADRSAAWWQRPIFYIMNSLLIFSIAVGSNAVGSAATAGGTADFVPNTAQSRHFFNEWFLAPGD